MRNFLILFAFLSAVVAFNSCSTDGPEPITLNKDMCDNCRMNISDGRFGGEVQTQKGRYYKFDDLKCMAHYATEEPNGQIKSFYIHDFAQNNVLIDATKAYYVWSKELSSPMRGNTAAFANKVDAEKIAQQYGSTVEDWEAAKKRILE